MTIGQRIKIRREELNLSQEELAKKIGYKSRSSINKIELDLYNLKQSKIKAIADALQTTPSYIMGWEVEKNPTPGAEGGIEDSLTAEIINLFKKLPDQKKQEALSYLRYLATNEDSL